MLALRATSAEIVTAGSIAVDVNTRCDRRRTWRAVSSCAPNVSCFFVAGREVELEELVVAADARRVDDRPAVGRERRRVVGDGVLREVRHGAGLEVDGVDVGHTAP